MPRLKLVSWIICLVLVHSGAASRIQITPESGHIRVNKSTLIMCKLDSDISDCKFKIDDRETLLLHKGAETPPTVVTEDGTTLYTARYAGKGVSNGECGISLSNVAKGFYVIGCQLRDWYGRVRQGFTTLLVDNSPPLKLKVKVQYQSVEPGSDVDILCSSARRQKLDHCGLRLPTKSWLNFKKGHRSVETDHYHYNGLGLDKGDCGVRLLNVTAADSGVVWCHAQAGAAIGTRGVVVRVGNLQPTTELLWQGGRSATAGETVQVECVMRGAYPLPHMLWRVDSKEVQCLDSDKTPWKDSTFRWMWEDQVMRQNIVHYLGNKLGFRRFHCSAVDAHSGYVCGYDRNSRVFEVRPACGQRTTTHYNTAYKSRVAKRDMGHSHHRVSKSRLAKRDTGYSHHKGSKRGEHPEGRGVIFMDRGVGDAPPKTWDADVESQKETSAHHGGDTMQNDFSETRWDEVTNAFLENVTVEKEPINYEEFGFRRDPHFGYYGAGFNPVIDLSNGTVLSGNDPNVEFVSYPWMAGVYKSVKGSHEQICGGTLVTETHVVSAAHCFWSHQRLRSHPVGDYMVALGKVFRDWDRVDGMVQKRGVRQLHLHPSWRGVKRNFQFDIAVIELSEAVAYTPRVAPACLDWDDDEKITGRESGVVTGWGYTEEDVPSETLRFSNLPYVDPDTCFDKLPVDLQGLLSTDKFCAGYTDRNVSVCPGDSGGGLLFKNFQYGAHFLKGVVSLSFKPAHVKGKCYAAEVTGFTAVSQSMPWLKRVLRYDGGEKSHPIRSNYWSDYMLPSGGQG